jgi:probable rRNA maturation factor
VSVAFENELETAEPLPAFLTAAAFEKLAAFVLCEEGVCRPCDVSITLVEDEEMRALNFEWRGIDKATDVLSLECERPSDPTLAPGETCELGDIVLAPAYLARQAQEFGATFEHEVTLMSVHGLLHLLGYDHMEEDEARVMEAREDALTGAYLGLQDFHARLVVHGSEDAPASSRYFSAEVEARVPAPSEVPEATKKAGETT